MFGLQPIQFQIHGKAPFAVHCTYKRSKCRGKCWYLVRIFSDDTAAYVTSAKQTFHSIWNDFRAIILDVLSFISSPAFKRQRPPQFPLLCLRFLPCVQLFLPCRRNETSGGIRKDNKRTLNRGCKLPTFHISECLCQKWYLSFVLCFHLNSRMEEIRASQKAARKVKSVRGRLPIECLPLSSYIIICLNQKTYLQKW